MPQSTGAFFEFLEAQALAPTKIRKTLSQWDSERIDQFLAEARQRVPYVREAAASRFSFVANSTLSGLPSPCSEIECRLRNLASMARFAALYADQVLVHDPFVERAYPPGKVNMARKRLADDLMIVYQIRPLMEAGIAGIAYRSFNICPIHGTHIVDDQEGLRARLAAAREALLRRLSKETQTYFDRRSSYALVNGPETLIDHGSRALQWIGESQPKLGRRRNADGDHSIIGKSRAGLLDAVAQPAIRDALVQSIYGTLYGHSYLTNRNLDVDLARAVNSNQTNIIASSLLSGFEHSLPFLQQLSLQDALTLRSAEGDAFILYREAMTRAITDALSATPSQVRTVFSDVVVPEIAKIGVAVESARKLAKRSVASDVLIGSGLVTIGLTSGIFSPSVAAMVGAAGGLKALYTWAKKSADALSTPPSAADHQYFFLWKAREVAQQRAKRPTIRTRK